MQLPSLEFVKKEEWPFLLLSVRYFSITMIHYLWMRNWNRPAKRSLKSLKSELCSANSNNDPAGAKKSVEKQTRMFNYSIEFSIWRFLITGPTTGRRDRPNRNCLKFSGVDSESMKSVIKTIIRIRIPVPILENLITQKGIFREHPSNSYRFVNAKS